MSILERIVAAKRTEVARARDQVIRRSLKEFAIGEHGEARRARTLVAARDRGRIELLAQHAARRARLLDLRNDRRAPGAQRADEIAHRRSGARLRLHRRERHLVARARHFGALGGDDALEDAHRFKCLVKATNSSSFFFAAPLRIAWLARSMPPFRVSARPAT